MFQVKDNYKKSDFSGGARDSIKRIQKELVISEAMQAQNDNPFCLLCGEQKESFQICHIEADSCGGSYSWDNLFIGCADCNAKQNNTHLKDFVSAKHYEMILKFAKMEASEEQKQASYKIQAQRIIERARSIETLDFIRKFGLSKKMEKYA